jgi:hypothetical protein
MPAIMSAQSPLAYIYNEWQISNSILQARQAATSEASKQAPIVRPRTTMASHQSQMTKAEELVRKHALKIVAAQGKRGVSLAHLGAEMKRKTGESQKATLKKTLQQFPAEFSINQNGVVRLIGKQAGPGKSPLPLEPFKDSLRIGGRSILEPAAVPSGPAAPESTLATGVTSLVTTEVSPIGRTPCVPASTVHDGQISLISDEGELRSALDKIGAFSIIALDCEGSHLSRTGRICLVQVALPSTETCLFDLISMDPSTLVLLKEGLGRILADPRITKVLHDCRRDSDAGIRLENVFDMQASYVELLRTRKAQAHSASGYIPLPGLNKLLKDYAGWENERKEKGRALMEKVFVGFLSSSFWNESARQGILSASLKLYG